MRFKLLELHHFQTPRGPIIRRYDEESTKGKQIKVSKNKVKNKSNLLSACLNMFNPGKPTKSK